jgi:hypothetical protein
MIRDLDQTIKKLFEDQAPAGSELKTADISFEIPDSNWRSSITKLTLNCYLYDIRQNLELRTNEPPMEMPPSPSSRRRASSLCLRTLSDSFSIISVYILFR